MGEAKRRGSFEVKKAEVAIAGRDPKARRIARRGKRIAKNSVKAEYLDFIKKLIKYM